MWDEALLELKRQSYSPVVKQQEAAYLADIYEGMGRYEQILGLEDQARRDGASIEPALATACARLGQTERARRLAHDAVRLKRAGAERAAGEVYLAEGDAARALWWFERAAQRLMHRERALWRAGAALMELGACQEARVVFTHALRASPVARPRNLRELAACLRTLGARGEAEQLEELARSAEA